MADNKSYYYMRLKEDFFDSDEMKLLEGEKPDGWMYSNILLKMYLRSLKNDGRLMLNGIIPYNAKMIASITGHSVGVVEKALSLFEALGLIEKLDNGAIYMLNIQNFIGKSSTEAERKKEYRKAINNEKSRISEKSRQKCSGQMSDKCHTDVLQMSDERTPEIEIDIDKDIDKDIESELNTDIDKELEIHTDINTICTAVSGSAEEPFITLTLNDKSEYPFFKKDIDEYKELYPAVDVEQQFRTMKGWCKDNPTKRKTKRGIRKFVNNWLAREQDKFHPVNGRTYDSNNRISNRVSEVDGWQL